MSWSKMTTPTNCSSHFVILGRHSSKLHKYLEDFLTIEWWWYGGFQLCYDILFGVLVSDHGRVLECCVLLKEDEERPVDYGVGCRFRTLSNGNHLQPREDPGHSLSLTTLLYILGRSHGLGTMSTLNFLFWICTNTPLIDLVGLMVQS